MKQRLFTAYYSHVDGRRCFAMSEVSQIDGHTPLYHFDLYVGKSSFSEAIQALNLHVLKLLKDTEVALIRTNCAHMVRPSYVPSERIRYAGKRTGKYYYDYADRARTMIDGGYNDE